MSSFVPVPLFTATVVFLTHICNSCTPPFLEDGTKFISGVQLLNGSLDDVLLSVRTEGSSNVYCQTWNAITGTLGSVTECDAVSTRAWNDGDTDASGTVISTVVPDADNDVLTVAMNRNGEQLTIANLSYANASAVGLEFKYWTMNELNATFLAVSYEMYSVPTIYGIQFASLNNNDNYEVLNVSATGNAFDASFDVTSSFEIAVFGSLNLIQFPLVCCLCYDSFVAQYELQQVSGQYTFTANSVISGGSVDVVAQRIYEWGLRGNALRVYDVNSGEIETYVLDLDTAATISLTETLSTTETMSTTSTTASTSAEPAGPSTSNGNSLFLSAYCVICLICFVTHLMSF